MKCLDGSRDLGFGRDWGKGIAGSRLAQHPSSLNLGCLKAHQSVTVAATALLVWSVLPPAVPYGLCRRCLQSSVCYWPHRLQ